MEAFTIKVQDFIKMRDTNIRNEYRIGNKIKEGSYGQVRWCIHKATGSLRAVKVIMKNDVKELSDDLIDEIQVLRSADHPGIIKIFEFFEDKKRFFIISELYVGGDLYQYIKEQKETRKDGMVVEEQRAKDIIRQLLIIVRYLHSRNIVHRDIKPENIMFETAERRSINIKLVDFGLAATI